MVVGMSRKSFLVVVGWASAAAAFCLPTVFRKRASKQASARVLRIYPIPGESYSPSFLRFCQHARFSSSHEAVARVKDPRIAYLLAGEARISTVVRTDGSRDRDGLA